MVFGKENIKKIFFAGVMLLAVILLFTIIDHAIHGLQGPWGVPDYYFKDKIPAGFFWAIVGWFLAKRFKNIWLKSFITAGTVAVALQVRYFIEGYDLGFVLIFLLFHFAILWCLLVAMFWLFGRYQWLASGNLNMKKIIIGIVILAILGLAAYYFVFKPKPGEPVPVAGNSVSMKNFSFDPPRLLVKIGTKVIWTNNDTSAHTVTSDSGNLLASADIAQGGTFEFAFSNPGSVKYHCELHPTMEGEIIVQN